MAAGQPLFWSTGKASHNAYTQTKINKYTELGLVFSFFTFLLLEPWIKQLTLEAGGCGVLCAEKQARPGPGPGLTAKEKSNNKV